MSSPRARADDVLDVAVASLAPPSVLTGSRRIDPADLAQLLGGEAAAVQRAVPSRQAEFATGRVLLRELLGVDVAIPVGGDRAPVLPDGVVGSLAHDHDVAVAAVSRDTALVAIGVDVEPMRPLERGVAALILRPDEHGLDAHLAFVLKEAAYKAWSRSGGRFLDHQDVRLEVGDDGTFTADVVDDGVRLSGRYAAAGDRWVALVVVTRTGDA